jgi:hypothetical protein
MQTNLGCFLVVTSALAKSTPTTPKMYEILALEFKDLKAQPTP